MVLVMQQMLPLLPLLVGGAFVASVAASPAKQPTITMNPEIIVPLDWLMNKKADFLFLPLEVPENLEPKQCKVMSNGGTILVMVTEQPQEELDTNALRKYKLLIEAIKQEVGHNEDLLRSKLKTWLDTEDDEEVQMHVREALDSLTHVQQAKNNTVKRSVSVSMGDRKPVFLHRKTLHLPAHAAKEVQPHTFLALQRRAHRRWDSNRTHTGIIKESFAVDIPFPVASNQVFVIKGGSHIMYVVLPLKRQSLEASGISTGGKPFLRAPMFDLDGARLAGPTSASITQLAAGRPLPSLVDELVPFS